MVLVIKGLGTEVRCLPIVVVTDSLDDPPEELFNILVAIHSLFLSVLAIVGCSRGPCMLDLVRIEKLRLNFAGSTCSILGMNKAQ